MESEREGGGGGGGGGEKHAPPFLTMAAPQCGQGRQLEPSSSSGNSAPFTHDHTRDSTPYSASRHCLPRRPAAPPAL